MNTLLTLKQLKIETELACWDDALFMSELHDQSCEWNDQILLAQNFGIPPFAVTYSAESGFEHLYTIDNISSLINNVAPIYSQYLLRQSEFAKRMVERAADGAYFTRLQYS